MANQLKAIKEKVWLLGEDQEQEVEIQVVNNHDHSQRRKYSVSIVKNMGTLEKIVQRGKKKVNHNCYPRMMQMWLLI